MATLSPVIASRTGATRRTRALLVLAAAALTVTGCSKFADGQDAEVLQIKDVVNGANADIGDGLIVARNMYASPAVAGQERIQAGDTLVLNGYIFNNSDNTPDTLTRASSDGTDIQLDSVVTIEPSLHEVLGAGANVGTWQVTKPTFVGGNVALTLDFSRAGSVTFVIPVEPAAVSVAL
jgi:hypothetical protein